MNPDPTRETLESLYRAAIAAADPAKAVTRAVQGWAPGGPLVIIAMGKAAPAMARAAITHFGASLHGGLIIAPHGAEQVPGITTVAGDHPIPGPGSRAAAEALGRMLVGLDRRHRVLVLLSGGASSLAGAPTAGLSDNDYQQLVRHLLGSGLDIHAVNAVRKAFSRWGGGRLTRALGPAPVRALAVSDVPGNLAGSIGSGPLTPDPDAIDRVRSYLGSADLPAGLRERLRGALDADPLPMHIPDIAVEIVADNRTALEGARREAEARGLAVEVDSEVLAGEAASQGEKIGLASRAQPPGTARIRGGETTVTLGGGHGAGGRNQELALAAAGALEGIMGPVLLAAGTDGRDGPTDAAGAIVDGTTWRRIREAGRNPARDLAQHDSHLSLDAAGALLRPGPTGTNVMDLVIAMGATA